MKCLVLILVGYGISLKRYLHKELISALLCVSDIPTENLVCSWYLINPFDRLPVIPA